MEPLIPKMKNIAYRRSPLREVSVTNPFFQGVANKIVERLKKIEAENISNLSESPAMQYLYQHHNGKFEISNDDKSHDLVKQVIPSESSESLSSLNIQETGSESRESTFSYVCKWLATGSKV